MLRVSGGRDHAAELADRLAFAAALSGTCERRYDQGSRGLVAIPTPSCHRHARTLNGLNVFVVNWPGVGCYDANSNVLDNFQLILIDRGDRGTGASGDDFDIEFNYDTLQWDTGQASGGDGTCKNGPAGNSAYVGYSNGNPADTYNQPGSGVPSAFLDSNTATGLIYHDMNSTTLGRYIFSVNNGQPAATTSLATSLSGGGQHGTSITVPSGAGVTDSATLSGANASTATGTVTYKVYSDSSCTNLVQGGSAETITTPGTLPSSQPVTLTDAGTYYWQATYSGDTTNDGSVSACSPGANNEVETVTAASGLPGVMTGQGRISGGGLTAQRPRPRARCAIDSARSARLAPTRTSGRRRRLGLVSSAPGNRAAWPPKPSLK
jgi:hypothetical protein